MADVPSNDIIRACNVIKTTGKLWTVKNCFNTQITQNDKYTG